jgi:hypothetical protein
MNSHDCFNFGKSGALFTANAPLAQQKKYAVAPPGASGHCHHLF